MDVQLTPDSTIELVTTVEADLCADVGIVRGMVLEGAHRVGTEVPEVYTTVTYAPAVPTTAP
ncbi:MAG: hypothetical protein LH650_10620 [Chloroflexi bacterium]|nr:hypothetical protein [Chloroflexota bacterium]